MLIVVWLRETVSFSHWPWRVQRFTLSDLQTVRFITDWDDGDYLPCGNSSCESRVKIVLWNVQSSLASSLLNLQIPLAHRMPTGPRRRCSRRQHKTWRLCNAKWSKSRWAITQEAFQGRKESAAGSKQRPKIWEGSRRSRTLLENCWWWHLRIWRWVRGFALKTKNALILVLKLSFHSWHYFIPCRKTQGYPISLCIRPYGLPAVHRINDKQHQWTSRGGNIRRSKHDLPSFRRDRRMQTRTEMPIFGCPCSQRWQRGSYLDTWRREAGTICSIRKRSQLHESWLPQTPKVQKGV